MWTEDNREFKKFQELKEDIAHVQMCMAYGFEQEAYDAMNEIMEKYNITKKELVTDNDMPDLELDAKEIENIHTCPHEWVSLKNEVIANGYMCKRCYERDKIIVFKRK